MKVVDFTERRHCWTVDRFYRDSISFARIVISTKVVDSVVVDSVVVDSVEQKVWFLSGCS